MTDSTPTSIPTTSKPRATRGTGFPVISLPEATKIIREAGTYGRQHTANALAAYAGHKTANSGAWKAKAAALRDWGLVVSAPNDSFALTERAMLIAHPTSPEDARQALLEAFNGCKLYLDIYGDMAKGVELMTSSIANNAVTQHKVSVTSKEAFAHSFVESAVAVGLAEQISADAVRLLARGFDPSQRIEAPGPNIDEEQAAMAAKFARGAPKSSTPVVQQTWPMYGGQIALSVHSDHPLDAKLFVELSNVINAIEKFSQAASSSLTIEPNSDVAVSK